MNAKERLDIVMKEYDAVRREIDNRTDTFRTHGVPVVTVAVAAIVGVRSNIPSDALLTLVPTVGLLILVISVAAWLYLDRVGRWLAIVEDRVYQISGEPLLTHETELVLDRQFRPGTWPRGAVIISAVYVVVEAILLIGLESPTQIYFAEHIPYLLLLITLISIPPAKLIADTLRMYSLRRQGLDGSRLYEFLRTERESQSRAQDRLKLQEQSADLVLTDSTFVRQSVPITTPTPAISKSSIRKEAALRDRKQRAQPE